MCTSLSTPLLVSLTTVPACPLSLSLSLSLSLLLFVVRRSGGRGGGGLALVIKSSTVVRSYEERAVLIARVTRHAPF